jgi:putative DNA primase/helicase
MMATGQETAVNGVHSAFAAARAELSMAPADEKLEAFQSIALLIGRHVRECEIGRAEAGDNLTAMAIEHGLDRVLRADGVQNVISMAIAGQRAIPVKRVVAGIEQFPARASVAPGWSASVETNSRVAPGLVIQRASEIEARPIDWLWPGRLAIGKQTILAGEPGLGKSQLSAFLAAAVTTGGDWPSGEGRANLGSVIVLSAEDDAADTIIPRLMAAGADLSRVHIVSAVALGEGKGRRMFNLQSDLAALERAIEARGDVRLVIIDPVSSYLGKTDSHKNAEVRAVLEPIGEMGSRLRVAVIGVTHFSKGAGTSANNRIIGSIAFVAAARAAFIVSRDPDDENRRLFVPSKNNLGPDREGLGFRIETREVGQGIIAPAVSFDGLPVTRTADEILSAISSGGPATSKDDAKLFLIDALNGGPASVPDLEAMARAHGLLGEAQRLANCKPIRSAADDLGVLKKREGFGPGSVVRWSLPDAPYTPTHSIRAHTRPISKQGAYGAYDDGTDL